MRLNRKRKVVDSSSPSDSNTKSGAGPAFSPPASANIQETTTSQLPTPVPFVKFSRPEGFDPDDYEKFRASQLLSTQFAPTSPLDQVADENVERVETSTRRQHLTDSISSSESSTAAQVVPDSQVGIQVSRSANSTQDSETQHQHESSEQSAVVVPASAAKAGDSDSEQKSKIDPESQPSTDFEALAEVAPPSNSQHRTALDDLREKTGVSPRPAASEHHLALERALSKEEPPATASEIQKGIETTLLTSKQDFADTQSSRFESQIPWLPTQAQEQTETDIHNSRRGAPPIAKDEDYDSSHFESFQTQAPYVSTQHQEIAAQASQAASDSQDIGPAAQPRDEILNSQSHSEQSETFASEEDRLRAEAHQETQSLLARQEQNNDEVSVASGSHPSKSQDSNSSTTFLQERSLGTDSRNGIRPRLGSIQYLLNGEEPTAAPQSGQRSPLTPRDGAPQSSTGSVRSQFSHFPTPEPEQPSQPSSNKKGTNMPFKAKKWTPGRSSEEIWNESQASRSSHPAPSQQSQIGPEYLSKTVSSIVKPEDSGPISASATASHVRDSAPAVRPPHDFIYVFALDVRSRIQKLYREALETRSEFLHQFLKENDGSEMPEGLEIAQSLVEMLHDITSHEDLIYSKAATEGESSDPAIPATGYSTTSSKFNFLHNLFQTASGLDKHIVLMAKPGPLSDMLEIFLQGEGINHSRPEKHARIKYPNGGVLQVTLLPTNSQGDFVVERADLVIAFDETFDVNQSQVRQVRAHSVEEERPCPVVVLVVSNSVQHIERSLPKTNQPEHQRLKTLLIQAIRLRAEFGSISGNAVKADELGKLVGVQLAANPDGVWDVPHASSVDISPKPESIPALKTFFDEVAHSAAQSRKRHMSQNSTDIDRSSKQPRTAEMPIGPFTSTGTDSRGAVPAAPNKASEQVSASTKVKHTTYLESSVADAQLKLQVGELRKELDLLQTRLEDETRSRMKLNIEFQNLEAQKTNMEVRKVATDKTINELKDERKALNEELQKAREMLANSTVPEQKEWEALRSKAAESDNLQKRLTWRTEELDHARKTYQEASARASELASENSTLRTTNSELERKASGLANDLRSSFLSNNSKALSTALKKAELERDSFARRNKEYHAEAVDLRKENAKMKEALETRAGMALSTRASSVPMNTGNPRQGTPGASGSVAMARGSSALARQAAGTGDLRRDAAANTAQSRVNRGAAPGSAASSRQNSPGPIRPQQTSATGVGTQRPMKG